MSQSQNSNKIDMENIPQQQSQSQNMSELKSFQNINIQGVEGTQQNQFILPDVFDKMDRPIKEFWVLNYHLMKTFAISLAFKFDLFEKLNETEDFLSIKDIMNKLNWNMDLKKIIDWLDTLYVNGFLEREGCGENAKYCLSGYSRVFFLKNGVDSVYPFYKSHLNLLENFNDLVKNLPSGKFSCDYKDIYSNEDIMKYKKDIQYLTIEDDYEKVMTKLLSYSDFIKNAKTIVDIAGRGGFMSSLLAKYFKESTIICYDKKEFLPFQREYEKEIGFFSNIIKFQYGYPVDEIPQGDIIFIPHLLEYLSCDDTYKVIENAYNALSDNGHIVILTRLISSNRNSDDVALHKSFQSFCQGIVGRYCTFEEISECLSKKGFKNINVLSGLQMIDVVIANK